MKEFRIAFFSNPPIANQVIPVFLQEKIALACVVTSIPRLLSHDVVDELQTMLKPHAVPVFRFDGTQFSEIQKAVLRENPTLVVSMNFGKKVPMELVQAVPLRGVNLHPALLPKYRGLSPYFWAILNGEKESGVTIHELTNDFDAGDIHLTEKVVLDPEETAGTLLFKCTCAGVKLLIQAIRELQAGRKLPRIPQDSEKVTYARAPNSIILEIHWEEKAEKVLALIRASSPFFGAYTWFRNFLLQIWSAEKSLIKPENVFPGTLILSQGKPEVACSDFLISLETVQMEYFRYYSGQEFLKIPGIKEGEKLGR